MNRDGGGGSVVEADGEGFEDILGIRREET